MTGESAVTSISERSTSFLIFLRFGLVPSIRNLRKFVQPSVMIVMLSGQDLVASLHDPPMRRIVEISA